MFDITQRPRSLKHNDIVLTMFIASQLVAKCFIVYQLMLLFFYHIEVIFTTMIGFVTWPSFCMTWLSTDKQKGSQVTKPIIVVKITCI